MAKSTFKMFTAAATALVLLLAGSAGVATAQEIDPESVAGVALTVPDLSILVNATIAADLVGALSDSTSEITVFAPVNDAFVELLGALEADGLDELDISTVEDVLLYHVVSGTVFSSDLTEGQVIETLEGNSLIVDLSDGVMIDGIGRFVLVAVHTLTHTATRKSVGHTSCLNRYPERTNENRTRHGG